MNTELYKILDKFAEDEVLVNQLIVTAFVVSNKISVRSNSLIKELVLPESSNHFLELKDHLTSFDFDDLIEAFELVIPEKEKQTNGAVYTPKAIKEFIISRSLSESNKPIDKIIGADISCGCGAFLFSLANSIRKKSNSSFKDIIENQIFGLDISESSIERTKILLTLLALNHDEDYTEIQFNLFTANALEFNWKTVEPVKKNEGFDLIIGNPPYVRAKHIDEASKKLLKNWQVTKTGNPDLYIPFFEIGYKNLCSNGILGYITVNSFYRSVNARSLRTYFQAHRIGLKIIDFGHEQIFENKLTYTCICFLSKESNNNVLFTKSNLRSLNKIASKDYTTIPYSSLNPHRGWLLSNPKAIENIQKIERCGKPLGKAYLIKNGIATLSNDIYIFKPIEEDNQYFTFQKDGTTYKVEKEICRDIIKPNILKYEHQIPKIKEKLIYPYTNGITPLSLMEEPVLKQRFPFAYKYLNDYRVRLAKRDKGNGDYGAWYAFGRTQALADKGLKLLFPYMSKHPHFVFTDQKEMLIYCGYAIFSDSKEELLVLKKLLESDVFNYYMQQTSKPYASGYYSYAKNYVKNFGVCELSNKEKKYILQEMKQDKINQFFKEKYTVTI
ncbi:MAG: N-6 DNA methylase [Bacteroidota bacterium]